MKLNQRQTPEFFMLDFGGQRLTHYPSGDTCLRQPYMVGDHAGHWSKKLTDFLRKHEQVNVVTDDSYTIVDDADTYPYRGRRFEVGDTLMIKTRSEWGVPATEPREIIDIQSSDPMWEGDTDHFLILEGDIKVFWKQERCGWFAEGGDLSCTDTRVRPKMDFDSYEIEIKPRDVNAM